MAVDGHRTWYETVGAGNPLVLLHGGLATNVTWEAQFDGLSPHRRVVAPERQAHGHTADRAAPLTYQSMADETVGFLAALGLGPVDLVGWSDGGMVGLLVAVQHPQLVRTLTTTGSGFSTAGYVPGSIEQLLALSLDDEDMVELAVSYGKTSPDGAEHFPSVWEKVRRMWAEPFDWSDDLARVRSPVLVVVGDDDYITVEHAAAMARRVPHGQLAVIPGASHLAPMEKPELFNQLVLDFTTDPSVHTMMALRRERG